MFSECMNHALASEIMKSEPKKIYETMLAQCGGVQPNLMILGQTTGLNRWINNARSWGLLAVYSDRVVAGAKKLVPIGSQAPVIEHFMLADIMEVQEIGGQRSMTRIEAKNASHLLSTFLPKPDLATQGLFLATVRGDFQLNVGKQDLGLLRTVYVAIGRLIGN